MREGVRLAVFERDRFTCCYCGFHSPIVRYFDDRPRWAGGPRWISILHIDHVIPRSKGGTDELENLVTACAPCNLAKYDRTPLMWLLEAA